MKKYQFNTQTDADWAMQIMTICVSPNWEGKIWTDYFWRWGCLITCIANIIQFFSCKKFTPRDMNSLCIVLNAYNYLSNPKCRESEASNLNWGILIENLSKSFEFKLNLTAKDYKENKLKMYIARIIHEKTGAGHYINVIRKISNIFLCFDVENGLLKSYHENEIKFLHEIKYIQQGV